VRDLPKTKKSLGQHWLTDPATLQSIVDLAGLKPEDTVLEIGPGAGTLTAYLVKKAQSVVAIEVDPNLAEELARRLQVPNLTIFCQDILQFDLTSLPAGYKVVANIPYYLTSNLIRTLSESSNPPKQVTLLVQKEVAQRVAASPGQMSLLSVSAQYYWEVRLGLIVPANLFTPPPKVDSQVLLLKWRAQLLFEGVNNKLFFRVVRAGFSARRKTLLNALRGGLQLDKDTAVKLLKTANLDANLRAQNLSLSEWYKLYQATLDLTIV